MEFNFKQEDHLMLNTAVTLSKEENQMLVENEEENTLPRKDSWTPDDDLILAEVCLRYIREGSTQLLAFDEASEKLERTPSACAFRWNNVLRKNYEQAIKIAKSIRLELKKKKIKNNKKEEESHNVLSVTESSIKENLISSQKAEKKTTLSLDDAIAFLLDLKNQPRVPESLTEELESMEKEKNKLLNKNQELQNENQKLKLKIEKMEAQLEQVQSDFQFMVKIMEKGRQMALQEEEEKTSQFVFRMDSNGNLEKIVK